MFRTFHIPPKSYGRSGIGGGLLAAFDRVAGSRESRNSQFKVEMMLVSGYAGIGKSSIGGELYKPLTAKRGLFYLGVKFDSFGQYSLLEIVDALKKWCSNCTSRRASAALAIRLLALGSNGQIIIDVILIG